MKYHQYDGDRCLHCGEEAITGSPACSGPDEDVFVRLRACEQERDRFAEYLSHWQEWSRKLHHAFGWLPETTWPDDTKGREKILHELERLREMHRSFAGHVYVSNEKYEEMNKAVLRMTQIEQMGVECSDCGGTGIGPTVVPASGESAETGYCPTCEGGGRVTKEYMRLREKIEAQAKR